jgi:hypothetical protein
MDTRSILTDLTQNECLTNEIAEAAVKQAKAQGQPFISAWRPSKVELPHFESDASCGCGPAD